MTSQEGFVDYSNATPFESFIAAIEEYLRLWSNNSENNHEFDQASIQFKHNKYKIMYYNYFKHSDRTPFMKQIMDETQDFPSLTHHHLQKWFGVQEFVVIYPEGDSIDPTESTMLLSALSIASKNANVDLACFVPRNKFIRGEYRGRIDDSGIVIRMQTEIAHEIPSLCTTLSGLIDLFTLNIGTASWNSRGPVKVSARYSWNVSWQDTEEWQSIIAAEHEDIPIYLMEWGTALDPIKKFRVSCRWKPFEEDSLMQNSTDSDFVIEKAPFWNISLNYRERSGFVLTDGITELISQYHMLEQRENEKHYKSKPFQEAVGSLRRYIRRSKKTSELLSYASGITGNNSSSRSSNENIDSGREDYLQEKVIRSIEAIFNIQINIDSKSKTDLNTIDSEDFQKLPNSCPPHSLLALLSIQMTFSISWENTRMLWKQFLRKIRTMWESAETLPHIPRDQPDWRDSILMQKLTMLNCCISQIKNMNVDSQPSVNSAPEGWEHETMLSDEMDVDMDGWDIDSLGSLDEHNDSKQSQNSQDSDEEFFDAVDSEDEDSEEKNEKEMKKEKEEKETNNSQSTNQDEESLSRKGSLGTLDDDTHMKEFPNRKIHIPETLKPPPITEDMASQQQKILAALGDSKQAAQIRNSMQSASLHSDMSAFKAANPGASLVDFLQWHSPRDVVQSDDGQPKISDRMSSSDNIWKQTWEKAEVKPASDQNPLFNPIREAELVLHYLENLEPSEWFREILLILFITALRSLDSANVAPLPPVTEKLKRLCHVIRDVAEHPSYECFQIVSEILEETEEFISSCTSVIYHLGTSNDDLITNLCQNSSASVINPGVIPFKSLISNHPKTNSDSTRNDSLVQEQSIRKPDFREYVMRCEARKPFHTCQPTAQRMYALLSEEEFRVASTFSQSSPF